ARQLAETAVRLDFRLAQARAELGIVLLLKRQHDDAIAEFERAFARSIPISSTIDTAEPQRLRASPQELSRRWRQTSASITDLCVWSKGFGQLHAQALWGGGAFVARMRVAPAQSAMASCYAGGRLRAGGTA